MPPLRRLEFTIILSILQKHAFHSKLGSWSFKRNIFTCIAHHRLVYTALHWRDWKGIQPQQRVSSKISIFIVTSARVRVFFSIYSTLINQDLIELHYWLGCLHFQFRSGGCIPDLLLEKTWITTWMFMKDKLLRPAWRHQSWYWNVKLRSKSARFKESSPNRSVRIHGWKYWYRVHKLIWRLQPFEMYMMWFCCKYSGIYVDICFMISILWFIAW